MMQLTFDQIRAVTVGAAYIKKTERGISFHRFTKEQEAFYRDARSDSNPEWYTNRCAITSGIRLHFRTDSPILKLTATLTKLTSATLFAFELFANGTRIGTLQNFNEEALPPIYSKLEFPDGRFAKTFELGTGEKELELFLPWSVYTLLEELSLADNATLVPIKREKKLLCFGDSITQGVCAMVPSNRYTAKLAAGLGMDEYNKGIGGERFIPALACFPEAFTPDLITVAYGTNDFTKCAFAEFEKNCKEFFQNLRATYPQTPICAITPIWRKHQDPRAEFGVFSLVDQTIRAACAPLENTYVIGGYDLLPHQEEMMADAVLHPNDAGFACYAENLLKEIKKTLSF